MAPRCAAISSARTMSNGRSDSSAASCAPGLAEPGLRPHAGRLVTETVRDRGDRSSSAAMPALDGLALVTGATGFVGSAVAAAVAAAGASVRVLARPGSDRRNLEGLPVVVAEGDLGDPASLGRALAGCRYLFHVAADYRLWVPDERPMLRANVEGTRSIMELALAAGVERILHTSSVAALGHRADGAPADETAQAYGRRDGGRLQALEAPGRGGGAPAGGGTGAAGGDRLPGGTDGPRRPQAHAHRAHDRRGGCRPGAGLCRYRPQHRPCARCGERPRSGAGSRPDRRALRAGRRQSEPAGGFVARGRWPPAAGRRGSGCRSAG